MGEPVTAPDTISLSPDRKNLAVALSDGNNEDVWLFDVERGFKTRFTFDAAADRNPVWSPDLYRCARAE